jgi:hypothetical protein
MNERLPWSTKGEAIFTIDIAMELNLYRFPHDSVPVCRLIVKDAGVV